MTDLFAVQQSEDQVEAAGVVKGVSVGIVTDNKDSSGQARVKVRFPWHGKSSKSSWARVGMMTGKGHGIYFLPEVGDEVLCAFDKGDIRFPYVVCSLWNGEHSSPVDNADGKNDLRLIRTRSGHEVVFDDGSEGSIDIHTSGKKQVYLDEHKIEITDGGSNLITMDLDGGSIEVKAAQSIKLSAPQISLEAKSTMELKGGQSMTLQATVIRIN